VKELEERLGIKLPGVLHLGQRIAVYIMEILQVPLEFIKELGMWNLDVFNKIYSIKLALQALKGFSRFKRGPKLYLPNQKEFCDKITSYFISRFSMLKNNCTRALITL